MPKAVTSADNKFRIRKAFEDFQKVVDEHDLTDARRLGDTTLEDVCAAAKAIDDRMAERGERRSVECVGVLVQAFRDYQGVMDVACPGIAYMPLIWAPIKFCLQATSNYVEEYEALTKAYGEISGNLPRFVKLKKFYEDRPDFQKLLVDFYCNIVAFHKRAYRFVRKTRPMKIRRFVDAAWRRFEFKDILKSLKQQMDLIDKQANAEEIDDAREMREKFFEEAEERSRRRKTEELLAVIDFLDVKTRSGEEKGQSIQEDKVNDIHNRCHGRTADWFVQLHEVKSWIRRGGDPLLWVTGQPGGGKSVLCSHLIHFIKQQSAGTLAFFIFDFRSPGDNNCSAFLRETAFQLICQNTGLIGGVYEEYYSRGHRPSKEKLLHLLPDLLSSISSFRLVVDGLDECERSDQIEIFEAISKLIDKVPKEKDFKAAVFSRNTNDLEKSIKKGSKKSPPVISLTEQARHIHQSIKTVIQYEIRELCKEMKEVIEEEVFEGIEKKLIDKANGMFIWVRLVIDGLKDCYRVCELEEAVETLPRDIEDLYRRVLTSFNEDDPPGSLRKARAFFSWIAFARCPLKDYEVVDGMVLGMDPVDLKKETKLPTEALNCYKPLIEISAGGYVYFVHFTVQNYILKQSSGPFLPYEIALHDIATGCVSYMKSSLDLVDPTLKPESCYENVALGLHGLNRYARSNWLLHVKQLCEACGEPEDRFIEQIKKLCERHKRLLQLKWPQGNNAPFEIGEENRFEVLENQPEFCRLAGLLQEHESRVGDVYRDELETHDSNSDPTLFTEISNRYDQIRQELLEPGSEDRFYYLPKGRVGEFKRVYCSGAYPCRVIACQRRPEGFENESDRHQHELKAHPRLYSCPVSGCRFYKSPKFLTRPEVDRHLLETHGGVHEKTHGRQKGPKRPRLEETFKPEEFSDVDKILQILEGDIACDNTAVYIASPEANFLDQGDPAQETRVEEEVQHHVRGQAEGQAPHGTTSATTSLEKDGEDVDMRATHSGSDSESVIEERERARAREELRQKRLYWLQNIEKKSQGSPKLQYVEQPNGSNVRSNFGTRQTVFCAYDAGGRFSNEPPNCVGAVCTIERVYFRGLDKFYLVNTEGESPWEVREGDLIGIADADRNHTLDKLRYGTSVLAMYPETPRFYRATVSQDWEGKYMSHHPESVEVKFSANQETASVERRFVIEQDQKK